jgi:hypothetical protein
MYHQNGGVILLKKCPQNNLKEFLYLVFEKNNNEIDVSVY